MKRSIEPRLPWHDVQVKVTGYAARDIAINFIQRWNWTAILKPTKPFLYPRVDHFPFYKKMDYPNCNVQILRSVGDWSTGLKCTETSIYKAMMETIKNSKHFIYIEVFYNI